MTENSEPVGGLLVLAGHAIWNGEHWVGGFEGEEAFYAAHVQQALLVLEEGYEALVLSGGCTRPALEHDTAGRSEAEGMKQFAIEQGWMSLGDDRVLLEPYARDTMENMTFGMLRYRREKGKWPSRVGVVSWVAKGLRIQLIGAGLQLGGRLRIHGVGVYPRQHDLERASAAEVNFLHSIVDTSLAPPSYSLRDPLLRGESFARKRWSRMPSKFSPNAEGDRGYLESVKAAYAAEDEVARNLLVQLERLRPGDSWRHVAWS